MQQLAPSPSQQDWPPHGLLSLWDIMKQFSLSQFQLLERMQSTVRSLLHAESEFKGTPRNAMLPSKASEDRALNEKLVKGVVDELMAVCEDMNLTNSLMNIRPLLKDPPRTEREVGIFYRMVMNELNESLFLVIPAERRQFWNNNKWIGEKTRASFPLATQEIRWAGTSFACGLSTACVFHLMRSAEYGLRGLARERKVTMPTGPIDWATWQDLIQEIRNKSRDLANGLPKGPKRDAAREFYIGALGQFEAFKDEYRNSVMHVRTAYDDGQAAEVLVLVPNFMERLSSKTTERGRQIRWS